jgi:hypothetical protein
MSPRAHLFPSDCPCDKLDLFLQVRRLDGLVLEVGEHRGAVDDACALLLAVVKTAHVGRKARVLEVDGGGFTVVAGRVIDSSLESSSLFSILAGEREN